MALSCLKDRIFACVAARRLRRFSILMFEAINRSGGGQNLLTRLLSTCQEKEVFMKKITLFLIVVVLCAPLCACGSGQVAETQSEATGASLSESTIDELLQGSWVVDSGENEGVFDFDQGDLVVSVSGTVMNGVYEIDTENSLVIGHLEASNGNVKVTIPYEYKNDALKLYNNKGQEMFRP